MSEHHSGRINWRARERRLRAKYREKIAIAIVVSLIVGLIGGIVVDKTVFTKKTETTVNAAAANTEAPADSAESTNLFGNPTEAAEPETTATQAPIVETETPEMSSAEPTAEAETETESAEEPMNEETAETETADEGWGDLLEDTAEEELTAKSDEETAAEEPAAELAEEPSEEPSAEPTEEPAAEATEEAAETAEETAEATVEPAPTLALNTQTEEETSLMGDPSEKTADVPTAEPAAENAAEPAAETTAETAETETAEAEETAEAAATEEPAAETTPSPDAPTIVPYGEAYTLTTDINPDGTAHTQNDGTEFENVSLTLQVKKYLDFDYYDRTYGSKYNLKGGTAAVVLGITLNGYTGTAPIIPQNFLLITFCDETGATTTQGVQIIDAEISGNVGVAITSDVPATVYKRYYKEDAGKEMTYMVVTTYNNGEKHDYWFEIIMPADMITPAPTADPEIQALTTGSRGDDVVKLQQALIDAGYLEGTADGVYGTKTADAVKLMQKQMAMEETGEADALFLTYLYMDTE